MVSLQFPKIVVAALAIAAVSFAAGALYGIGEGSLESGAMTSAQETSLLKKCIGTLDCPVYYVSALSGAFPVPSRYRLVTKPESELRFFSYTSDVFDTILDREPRSWGRLGTIDIGLRQELEAGSNVQLDKLVAEYSDCGISMTTVQSDFVKTSRHAKVIFNSDRYVMIVDDNPELAETLAAAYCKINTVSSN